MSHFIELLTSAGYFGGALSIACYLIGMAVQKKTHLVICNPILIGFMLVIAFLKVFHIEYEQYNQGAKYVTYFLNIATISRAVLLYEQIEALKKNYAAILIGIFAGVLANAVSVLVFAVLFGLSHMEYVTFLPKSVTTAMALALSEEYGGYVSLTLVMVVVAGISGNIMAVLLFKVLHITEPVAKGISLGCASHAMGSVKAWELGEVEGAMGSLAIAVTGLMTCIVAAVFCEFY